VCNAEIAALPGAARGMVAKQLILPGQIVLQCAAANILAVPKTEAAVAAWQLWLQAYTATHGPLPQQLLDLLAGAPQQQCLPRGDSAACQQVKVGVGSQLRACLVERNAHTAQQHSLALNLAMCAACAADTTRSPTVRLASWLLYLRNGCSTSCSDGSASSRPSAFWCSYIALLQACGPMAAVCSGAWGQAELQQLEPPALRVSRARGQGRTMNPALAHMHDDATHAWHTDFSEAYLPAASRGGRTCVCGKPARGAGVQ
jgi:hypothetical protein